MLKIALVEDEEKYRKCSTSDENNGELSPLVYIDIHPVYCTDSFCIGRHSDSFHLRLGTSSSKAILRARQS